MQSFGIRCAAPPGKRAVPEELRLEDNVLKKAMRLTISCLRLLFFIAIVSPLVAGESAYFPSPDALQPVSTQAPDEVLPPLPAPAAVPISETIPQTQSSTSDGSCVSPSYWMVSSRQSVQTIHFRGRGPWGLNVEQLNPNGTKCPSDVASMACQLIPGMPVCIFVHGSFVELPNQYVEAAGLYSQIQGNCHRPVQLIFFTWPSDGPYSGCFPIDVAVRGRQADFNGFHLAYLLSQIPESCPVCLIGHSHGSRVILSALHLGGGGTVEGFSFPGSIGMNRRIRVILAAGAMDHHWMNPGQPFGCALNRVECLLNLQNRHDFALFAYPISRPFGRRAIARSGVTPHDARKLGYNAAKLRDFDVTEYVGMAHLWPAYYKQPVIIGAMIPYLCFE